MTREKLLSLLSHGLDAVPTLTGGGVLLCHRPTLGPMAYLHRIYPPLSLEDLATFDRDLGRKAPKSYRDFLCSVGNGANIFNMHLYGFVGQLRRDSSDHLGQPISLNYGNAIERPNGLDEDVFSIGGMVGWSSKGVLLMEPSGEVRLVHHRDGRDVAASWSDLDAMLEEEISRRSLLYDRMGNPLTSSTNMMHPAGRRWETSAEPLCH